MKLELIDLSNLKKQSAFQKVRRKAFDLGHLLTRFDNPQDEWVYGSNCLFCGRFVLVSLFDNSKDRDDRPRKWACGEPLQNKCDEYLSRSILATAFPVDG